MNLPSDIEEATLAHRDILERMKQADIAYYEDDAPIMSDIDYDALRAAVLAIETEFPSLVTPDSPTQKVSGKSTAAFESVKHRVRMESLDNTFTPVEVAEWAAKLAESGDAILAQHKMDGLSLSLVYINGHLDRAVTRGDGETGEDVTHTALEIIDLPTDISEHLDPKYDEIVEVRGEVYMTKEQLAALNAKYEAAGKKKLANCRNAAAGSIRQKDPAITRERGIRFMAFGVTADTFPDLESDAEVLDVLQEMNFDVVPHVVLGNSPDAIEAQINGWSDYRPKLDYDIDGIVWKLDNRRVRNQMGSTSRAPRWATAYKFPAERKTTTLINVTFQVGRTGAVTPVAHVQPVQVGGVTVSTATLHNEAEIRRLGLQIGYDVVIQRAGDVIPQVVECITPDTSQWGDAEFSMIQHIEFPTHCPACDTKLVRPEGEAVSRCPAGYTCPPQQKAYLEHFVSRDAMDIDGLGPAQIADMITFLGLSTPSQIMTLPEANVTDFDDVYCEKALPVAEAMENWPGYGKTSVKKLMTAIKKARKPQLDRFIYALGIRNIGKTTAKDIAKRLGTLDEFSRCARQPEYFAERCGDIDGIGPVVIASFEDHFRNTDNFTETFDLVMNLEIQNMPQNTDGPKPLAGEVLCFTGSFDRWSREQCLLIAEELGAGTTNAPAKKTTILVAGDNVGAKKIEAAEKHGTTIKDPQWFVEVVEAAIEDGYKLDVMD
ncbi:DNA ligase [Erythrobacter phage vB_EliS-L02]|nr:DNA ligase [Erythrobacter phage vB_EliS-L02]